MRRLAAVLLCCLPLPLLAARPFIVDDARVVDRGACQVESWVKHTPGGQEWWALPACNPFGVELTAGGGALFGGPGDRDHADYQFQAKVLARPLETNAWGWGVAAGAIRHADINVRQNLWGNYYFYVPVSRSFADDRLVLLFNAGGIDSRDDRRRGLSYGVGAEIYLTPRFMIATEAYGATGFDRFSQLGFRLWLVPERVQIDSTYGFQLNGPHRTEWVTLGFRLISRPFF
ncbi:MAG: hypothetical protein ING80_05445 [Rhodocyclaceae bacterium]|jgi:hypothetical protein|nr:hypothetical protein [Rhodocyclaceae bacterium]MCA3141643.1 hypothetical protein [Rhodocyclaceae bacterium]